MKVLVKLLHVFLITQIFASVQNHDQEAPRDYKTCPESFCKDFVSAVFALSAWQSLKKPRNTRTPPQASSCLYFLDHKSSSDFLIGPLLAVLPCAASVSMWRRFILLPSLLLFTERSAAELDVMSTYFRPRCTLIFNAQD